MIIGYLHIGPERSGVRRYGRMLAQEAQRRTDVLVVEYDVASDGDESTRMADLQKAAAVLIEADVVHLQYNKKVWGGDWRHVRRVSAFLRGCGSRLVVTLHDVYRPGVAGRKHLGLSSLRAQIGRALDSTRVATGRLARDASALIVHSQEEARRLASLHRGRLCVIPHFVEQRSPATDALAARTALGLDKKRVITLAGFVVPRKGHHLVLDALPSLPDDVMVVFAGGAPVGGDGYVKGLRRSIERRGLTDRVRLTGYLSDEEMEQYLMATDLAVCPFEELSASGSLATWISVAKPMLASNLPQMAEYNQLERNSIHTFAPYTATAFAYSVEQLLAENRDGPEVAVARLRDRLSMPRIFNEHLKIYREAAAMRGPGGRTRLGPRLAEDGPKGEDAGVTGRRVAFLPLWLNNPYQARLGHHLSLLGLRMIRLGKTAGSILVRLVQDRPQILHLHWLHPFYESRGRALSTVKLMYSLGGILMLKSLGVRLVWTAHNLRHHEGDHPTLDRMCTWTVAQIADAIIAHSATARRRVIAAFGRSCDTKIQVIPHGNYIGAYSNEIGRAEARKELAIPDESLAFLFLGQVRPYKGVLEMVDAFRGLETGDVRLIIAGKPLNDSDAQAIRDRMGDDERITFSSGFVPDEKIQVYMNACDAVVLPYRDILTSGAAVLAMSFGRACVAPRLGCMIDWFGDGGALLYDPDDPRGLRGALERAIESRALLPDMGRRNLDLARIWSWHRVAQDTARVYRSILL